ncbi:DUF4248 domain-containing protein [Phocaeicola barnesiae]|jgi:hypothetical protein|uniref:DUF4248 domain-containing protein n=1 Tax=Phocaeicola barnesiae TaxID=376804 RepID=A0AAW5N652_9BACT|nr:DUF4248 domain-containing protein [Phocaeicola barnesiae]CDD33786.1 putative uncharacterized protein [Bacteroides sp. CAG:714]MCF2599555.1 DUF4248 domain-containing protein [Phocaeicola barnesiae]MCR8872929.1 DUF4248 domain-containing protein [Phocaeicola barnesiae]MDM8234247.1 DUF4248 domain-containing protein [Phocaeicola barnesiae]MDM8240772.1 DUF4248 domain-containing protein [Phocaeicola barnesiae]
MVAEQTFRLRIYRKNELAMLYFPESSKQTAMRNLGRWIQHCTPLKEELLERGYDKNRKYFLKHEVELILKHFGEP